jgi:Family of unknown function (DUF7002)
VIVLNARTLVDDYEDAVELASFNTGAIGRARKKRGIGSFLSIADYPTKPSGRPAPAIQELTVTRPITKIQRYLWRVERWRGGEKTATLYP